VFRANGFDPDRIEQELSEAVRQSVLTPPSRKSF
jgi:hypothetical protein